MKKTLFSIGRGLFKLTFIAVVMMVLFSVLTAQYPSVQDLFVKIIHPSTSTSTAGVTLKNNAYSATAFLIKNSRGTTIFSVDSSGNPSGVGGTFTGATSFTNTVAISNTATIKNLTVGTGITAGKPLLITGKLGSTVASIDSTGAGVFVGITTTGAITATSQTITVGTVAATNVGAHIMTGSSTATDSTTSIVLKDSAGKKWKLRVYTNGAILADSTGLN